MMTASRSYTGCALVTTTASVTLAATLTTTAPRFSESQERPTTPASWPQAAGSGRGPEADPIRRCRLG